MRQQSNPLTVPMLPSVTTNGREMYIFLYLVSMTTAAIAIFSYSCASFCFFSSTYENTISKHSLPEMMTMNISSIQNIFFTKGENSQKNDLFSTN